jgi:hypothetical protein
MFKFKFQNWFDQILGSNEISMNFRGLKLIEIFKLIQKENTTGHCCTGPFDLGQEGSNSERE